MGLTTTYGDAAFLKRAPHSTSNPNTLLHHAEMAQGPLMQFTIALTNFLDLDPETRIVRGSLKLKERMLEKAAKHNGDLSKVDDLVRNRITHTGKEAVIMIRSLAVPGKNSHPFWEEWANRGIHLVEAQDAYWERKKSGCVGFDLKVMIDLRKGRWHTAEIQLMEEDMQKIDTATRYTYDTFIRPVTDVATAEDRELTAEESDQISPFRMANTLMYDGGLIAKDLVGLLSPKGFKEFMERQQQIKEENGLSTPQTMVEVLALRAA